MTLDIRARRIIAGKSTLETELETASSTEWVALCLIMGRDDLLEGGDRLRAWQRLDDDQRQSVGRHNRSTAYNLRGLDDDHLNAACMDRIRRAREGDTSPVHVTTSQAIVVALVAGGRFPAPYDTLGAAWLRLDDRQRRLVQRENPERAAAAEADAVVARQEGFADHGRQP
jgi:predicted Fe-S protein YdhL (DUF1289 family)